MNHTVLLGGYHLITIIVSLHDPIVEWLADDCVSDIANELAREPMPVPLLG